MKCSNCVRTAVVISWNIKLFIEECGKLWSELARRICDNKYLCDDGSWLNYRVLTDDNLDDVLKILTSKFGKKKG